MLVAAGPTAALTDTLATSRAAQRMPIFSKIPFMSVPPKSCLYLKLLPSRLSPYATSEVLVAAGPTAALTETLATSRAAQRRPIFWKTAFMSVPFECYLSLTPCQ